MLSLFPSLQPGVSLLQLNSLNARHREAEAQGRDVEGTAEPHRRDVSKAESQSSPSWRQDEGQSFLLLTLVPAPFSRLKAFLLPKPPATTPSASPPPTPGTHGPWALSCAVRVSVLGPKAAHHTLSVLRILSQHSHKADGTSLRLLKNCSSASSSASRLGALTSNLLVQHQVNKCNKCHLEA